jgi:hypothetical protein
MENFAQNFEISAQLRPRLEYRHGFKTLFQDSEDAAVFVSQRSRLNLGYTTEKFNLYLSLQNVRIWGEVATMATADVNGTAVHEAWAEVNLNSQIAFKFGRQELVYDDERLFGNVDWAQQARSHDALLFRFKPSAKHQLDLGLAINAERESIFEQEYLVNEYKSMQYLWYHTNLKNIKLSLIALNTGYAFEDDAAEQEIDYFQTFGTHLNYGKNRMKADASLYYQTGQLANADLSAYNASLNATYSISKAFSAGLGAEYISGTDMDATNGKLESFNPLFGTNHKFNGLMDYFYVGNHINSVGLMDLNAKLIYHNAKFSAQLAPHLFSSAATIVNSSNQKVDDNLGTEIDLTLNYHLTKDLSFHAGYSHLFATESMETLKGGNSDATNNWAWFMINVNPSLFKTSFSKKE